MNRICRALRYGVVFACTLSLLSYAPSPYVSEASALSIEDEREMGEEFMAQVLAQLQLVDDPFVNQYINDLGQYLIRPLETKSFPFNFYVIKDPTLNAFAAPGGHIFVFSGLIEAMDSIDELAAVICHEIGHISARHLSQRIEQSKTIGLATLAGILAGMLLGGEVAGAIMTGSIAAGMQAQLHYSREDERQADQLSFKYMTPTGFDPEGMIHALNKIQKGSYLGTGKIPAYLLTHPTGPERMANLESMLNKNASKTLSREAALLESRFPAFKTVITAKCLDPRDAERVFKKELEKDPAAPLAHFGLGMAYMEQSSYDRAIEELKQSLEAQPDFIPALRALGEVYQMNGQDKEAEAVLEKVLRLDHGDKTALFLLGVTYESAGRNREALRFFEKLSYLPPVRNDVFYHLGLLYGREKRLALAHYYFGVYFKRIGETQKAEFHFKKAGELAREDPDLRKKIQKETEEPGREAS
ncbi:MAG: M48 family metalloprotease [Deltaproteobacteria bacterium]|nr:M48 family metalloprotease [Deltaproteobacteria bacterium]